MISRIIDQTKNELEFTNSIYGDSLVIALKTPSRPKSWNIYMKMFSWEVWLALLGTLVFINRAMIWLTAGKPWSCSFGIIVHLICCVPLARLPTSTRERLVLGTGFFMSLVAVITFQAALFHLIKESGVHSRFKTVSDVINHHNKLVTNSKLIKLYFYAMDDEDIKPKESTEVVPATDEWFDRFPMAISLKKVQLLMRTGQLRSDLYIVQEFVGSYSLCYTVNRGSPFLQRLSQFTTRVFESGLSEKWHTMSVLNYETKSKMYSTLSDESRKMDFDVAFTIYFFGKCI